MNSTPDCARCWTRTRSSGWTTSWARKPVVELEYLRFGNLALVELWDRHVISEIQITMAENFGVDDRGKFYDKVGALRDVVQKPSAAGARRG